MEFEKHKSLKTLTQEEELVYRLVVESSKRGIKSAEIAKKSGMNTTSITKILNRLQLHDFIKSFKKPDQQSGSQSKSILKVKLWFDDSIDPGEEYLTQKSFCKSDGQIDELLVQRLCDKVMEFVQAQPSSMATFQELCLIVKASAGSVKDPDIRKLIEILLYDQRLEQTSDPNKYRLNYLGEFQQEIIINQLPCGQCPVFKICRPGNRISPENCIYFADW